MEPGKRLLEGGVVARFGRPNWLTPGKKTGAHVTRFGDLLSVGATRCIFSGVSPGESVYATVDHGGVDVSSVDLKLP